jgi:hypothetical protein
MNSFVVVGLVALGVVIVIAFVIVTTTVARRRRRSPYERRRLLSPAELLFFHVLLQAVGDEYLVFAKVRVADLLRVRSGTSEPQAHLNRIIAKHVDFVLCDRASVDPVLTIELDDSSHAQGDRPQRDKFLDDAFSGAELRLLRVPARRTYDPTALRADISSNVGSATQTR